MPLVFDELWSAAEGAMLSLGCELTPECETIFIQMLRNAAARLDADKRGYTLVERQRVLGTVELLVAAMYMEAQPPSAAAGTASDLTRGPVLLHEFTLSGALSRLCPCYPFC
jgi:hypothetical protein